MDIARHSAAEQHPLGPDAGLGVGVKLAQMEILGGMMPQDDSHREENLRRAYELGRTF